MTSPPDSWHELSAAGEGLPPEAAGQLRDAGFTVLPGPELPGGIEALARAYDRAVATAEAADGSIRSSVRVSDFVNRGPEFDGLHLHRPLLAAGALIVVGPFKLSGMRARTRPPGAPQQALHVDVKRGADEWTLVGFILMVDAFEAENGATRFVPGSHLWPGEPDATAGEVLACGPAGSMIVFNASVWHRHTANRPAGRGGPCRGTSFPGRRGQPSTTRRACGRRRFAGSGTWRSMSWTCRPPAIAAAGEGETVRAEGVPAGRFPRRD